MIKYIFCIYIIFYKMMELYADLFLIISPYCHHSQNIFPNSYCKKHRKYIVKKIGFKIHKKYGKQNLTLSNPIFIWNLIKNKTNVFPKISTWQTFIIDLSEQHCTFLIFEKDYYPIFFKIKKHEVSEKRLDCIGFVMKFKNPSIIKKIYIFDTTWKYITETSMDNLLIIKTLRFNQYLIQNIFRILYLNVGEHLEIFNIKTRFCICNWTEYKLCAFCKDIGFTKLIF
ncbi:hypothetical protein KAH94_06495, partial [bacterium]|nr:hypothetical protein [bacterium]